MGGPSNLVRWLAVVAAAAMGTSLVGPARAAAPPAPVGPGTPAGAIQRAFGQDWRVDQVPEGYRVTLRLDQPVPLRAAHPVLAVDGRPVGVARQSADRLTLTTVTPDPRVRTAGDVTLVWSTAGPGQRGSAGET